MPLEDFPLPFLLGQSLHPLKVLLNSLPDDLRPVTARRAIAGHNVINALKHMIINSYSNSFHMRDDNRIIAVIQSRPIFASEGFAPEA